MIFGKHINIYYRKYALALLTGLLALFAVDYLQLKVPEIYQLVINGLNQGCIVENGAQVPFDMAFLLDRICMPMHHPCHCLRPVSVAGNDLRRCYQGGDGSAG